MINVQELTAEHKVLLCALLVWFDVEKPEGLVSSGEHNSYLLLKLNQKELKGGVWVLALTFALELSLLRSYIYLQRLLLFELIKILSAKVINDLVKLLKVEDGSALILWFPRFVFLSVSPISLRGGSNLILVFASVKLQKVEQNLLIRSAHSQIDISVEILEVFTKYKVCSIWIISLAAESQSVDYLWVEVVLLHLPNKSFEHEILRYDLLSLL